MNQRPAKRPRRIRRPVAIDLCCGRGGWIAGLEAAGFQVIGFDVEQWSDCPGVVACADVRSLDGSAFSWADLVVASPPCTEFSKHDQKGIFPNLPAPDMSIVEACFRFAERSSVPLVLENVRGLQKFIGPAKQHYGSFYLWGDVPPLMPHITWASGTAAAQVEPPIAASPGGDSIRTVVPRWSVPHAPVRAGAE